MARNVKLCKNKFFVFWIHIFWTWFEKQRFTFYY